MTALWDATSLFVDGTRSLSRRDPYIMAALLIASGERFSPLGRLRVLITRKNLRPRLAVDSGH